MRDAHKTAAQMEGRRLSLVFHVCQKWLVSDSPAWVITKCLTFLGSEHTIASCVPPPPATEILFPFTVTELAPDPVGQKWKKVDTWRIFGHFGMSGQSDRRPSGL